MAGRIKLFQSVQKYHRTMGIYQLQPNQRWLTFNSRNLLFLVSFIQMLVTTIGFSIFHAKTTIEYGACYYAYISEIGSTTYFLLQMCQITNFSKLIEHFEEFIEESKYALPCMSFVISIFFSSKTSNKLFLSFVGVDARTMYNKLNKKIELASHIIHLCLVWVSTSGVVVPPLIITIVNYVIYGLGDESFYLAFPVM